MPRISKARQDEVRGRILEAGITVFEQRGFDRASISAIADEAGLSSGSIYTYYESKQELFLSAFGTLVEEDEQALAEAISESRTTADAIDLAVDYFAQLVVGGEGFRGAGAGFLIHAWAGADQSEPLRLMLVRRREQACQLAQSVIESAISRGELRAELDAQGLAQGIVSLLDGLFLQRAEQGSGLTLEQARRQAHAVIDALFGVSGPGASPASDRGARP